MLLRQLIAVSTIALSIVCFVPQGHAETVSACRARAYRQYDALVDSGYTEAEARKVLNGSLKRCERNQ